MNAHESRYFEIFGLYFNPIQQLGGKKAKVNVENLFCQIEQFQRDIREKDILIHQKTNKMKQISEDLAQKTNEISILRRSVENLREQVSFVACIL